MHPICKHNLRKGKHIPICKEQVTTAAWEQRNFNSVFPTHLFVLNFVKIEAKIQVIELKTKGGADHSLIMDSMILIP